MLSQGGILTFSTSIRRLTSREAGLVRNREDREIVFSVFSLHKTSLFVHHLRLMDTQSPDAVIPVLSFETLTEVQSDISVSLNLRVLAVWFSNVLFACFTVLSPPFRGPH